MSGLLFHHLMLPMGDEQALAEKIELRMIFLSMILQNFFLMIGEVQYAPELFSEVKAAFFAVVTSTGTFRAVEKGIFQILWVSLLI